MYFPEAFITVLIIASLAGVGIGAVSLIILLIKDIKSKKLW